LRLELPAGSFKMSGRSDPVFARNTAVLEPARLRT